MKHYPYVFAMLFCVLSACSSPAQQLMPTVYDAQKLKDNDSLFLGKPLSILLKEIGPEIVTVSTESQRAHHALSYLIFKFISREEQGRYKLAGKRSLSILIFVKENFDWDKPGDKMMQWTREDAQRLGHLTIVRIGIVGESLPPIT